MPFVTRYGDVLLRHRASFAHAIGDGLEHREPDHVLVEGVRVLAHNAQHGAPRDDLATHDELGVVVALP